MCTWTSIELHEKYLKLGVQLTRKQMFSKLVTHLGDGVVVNNSEGCASIVGFRDAMGEILNLVKIDSNDEETDDVSAHQFVEQTYMKMGKGGLTGLTLSTDILSEWINGACFKLCWTNDFLSII